MHDHSKFNLPSKQKPKFGTLSHVTVTQARLKIHLAALYTNKVTLAQEENEPMIICPTAI